MLNRLVIAVVTTLLFASCGNNTEKTKVPQGGTYFSINQFIQDQWKTYGGQPFGMQKMVYMNGEKDSSLTNALEMEWSLILKPFFESDISDPKYLGRYNFSSFKDDDTYTINLYYEAKEEKLFTRKLMISADDMTAKVKSIYIETEGKNITRKLLYMPLKIISIQEFEHSGAANKELRIEYRFLH